ncbi:MAG: hypothetical protein FWB80_09395, partial [Defluviitaleaceae bacterium]|nr:hypothetical protein [Defluviitaleaceae bacterium]
MKVKRYEGKSEAVLMPIIIEEMGEGATIISVKQKPKTGFFGFFRKPSVIITAACEDDVEFMNLLNNQEAKAAQFAPPLVERKPLSADLVESKSTSAASIEESMTLLLQEARKAANQIEKDESTKRQAESPVAKKEETQAASPSATEKKYKHSMV